MSIPHGRRAESFADDLNTRRGIVSGRVALLPRSTEIQPHVARIRPPHSSHGAHRGHRGVNPGMRGPPASAWRDSSQGPDATRGRTGCLLTLPRPGTVRDASSQYGCAVHPSPGYVRDSAKHHASPCEPTVKPNMHTGRKDVFGGQSMRIPGRKDVFRAKRCVRGQKHT